MDWIQLYTQLMEDESNNIQEVSHLIENNLPKKLYRYRCYGRNWLEELYEEKIYMSQPGNFNDPFDCTFNVDVQKHINKLNDNVFHDIKIESQRKFEQELNNNYNIVNMIYSKIRDKYRIACFTPIYDSILMWSHYANSHTGYCIEYNVQDIYKITDSIYPVIYTQKRYDDTNYIIGNKSKGINHLIHKAHDWNYEKEWRIIANSKIFNEKNGEYLELPNAITAVYIGVNSESRKEVQVIKEFANAFDIPIFKMRPSKRQYKLVKDRI